MLDSRWLPEVRERTRRCKNRTQSVVGGILLRVWCCDGEKKEHKNIIINAMYPSILSPISDIKIISELIIQAIKFCTKANHNKPFRFV